MSSLGRQAGQHFGVPSWKESPSSIEYPSFSWQLENFKSLMTLRQESHDLEAAPFEMHSHCTGQNKANTAQMNKTYI